MNTVELLSCLTLIVLSALLSATEVALFSLSRFQLRNLRETFRSSYQRIRKLLSDPSGLLITILVTNEIINISLSTIIVDALSRKWEKKFPESLKTLIPSEYVLNLPPWVFDTFMSMLVVTPIVLVFCEIFPKVIGVRINQVVAPVISAPLLGLYHIATPMHRWIKRLISFLTKRLGKTPTEEEMDPLSKKIKEDEFLILLEKGHQEGLVDQNELELIRNVFQLDDTRVSDIVIPIPSLLTIPAQMKIKDALYQFKKKNFYRIPVHGADKNEIVGILYAKDLLSAKFETERLEMSVDTVMRRPLIVPLDLRLNVLFRKFKQSQTHMAVVVNAQNKPTGIVTMGDLLYDLVEDIFPEEEEDEEESSQKTALKSAVPDSPKDSPSNSPRNRKTSPS